MRRWGWGGCEKIPAFIHGERSPETKMCSLPTWGMRVDTCMPRMWQIGLRRFLAFGWSHEKRPKVGRYAIRMYGMSPLHRGLSGSVYMCLSFLGRAVHPLSVPGASNKREEKENRCQENAKYPTNEVNVVPRGKRGRHTSIHPSIHLRGRTAHAAAAAAVD